ncbi:hypothetical protein [Histidinibacterium aquaticum]|uniref:Uncharacterized protein n=1 Tax=Histidinibacterium aquaticum TaxID=2613962 RepID=A0A5J5GQ35_9RHOB|nr:hypothetical protein [Histidinibacterium aquaticum]KAA9010496.1 hypothetical protein F3S47_04430 [Histidinibacterium aquaticum]
MHPEYLAITVVLSIWAVEVSPAAPGVLMAVSLMTAGLMLLRWIVQQIMLIIACRGSASRVDAQLTLARALSRAAKAPEGVQRAIDRMIAAYALRPGEADTMPASEVLDERQRLALLLADEARSHDVLPTGLRAPGTAMLRDALMARAGTAAETYGRLFEEAEELAFGPAVEPEEAPDTAEIA